MNRQRLVAYILLIYTIAFIFYFNYTWLSLWPNIKALQAFFSVAWLYAFVIWILLGVYASLRTSLINKLVVAALVLIVAGSLLEFFPISNGFGCVQYTGNVCTTTNQVSQANNIAIFGYFTLISAVLAIFIDTMRSEDSATPPPA
jgi:hypothetical protein